MPSSWLREGFYGPGGKWHTSLPPIFCQIKCGPISPAQCKMVEQEMEFLGGQSLLSSSVLGEIVPEERES